MQIFTPIIFTPTTVVIYIYCTQCGRQVAPPASGNSTGNLPCQCPPKQETA